MKQIVPLDLKSNATISETTSEFYRNNGYYAFIEYQLTTASEMNLAIEVGQYPLVVNANLEAQGQFQYVFKTGPTYSGGTPLRNRLINYGTNPGQFSTSASGEVAYWILSPATKYTLQLTPSASLRMTIDLRLIEVHV